MFQILKKGLPLPRPLPDTPPPNWLASGVHFGAALLGHGGLELPRGVGNLCSPVVLAPPTIASGRGNPQTPRKRAPHMCTHTSHNPTAPHRVARGLWPFPPRWGTWVGTSPKGRQTGPLRISGYRHIQPCHLSCVFSKPTKKNQRSDRPFLVGLPLLEPPKGGFGVGL